MANVQRTGFTYWGSLTAGEGNQPSIRKQEVANNYSTGIFKGDVIKQLSDGTVAAAAASDNGVLLGVAVGFEVVTAGGTGFPAGRRPVSFIPASTTFTPTTVGSPNASWVHFIPFTGDNIFQVCADDATSVTTIAAGVNLIGENADLVTGSGDTRTGRSGYLLDISTHAATTFNFRIIGIEGYPGLQGGAALNNDLTLIYASYLVTCNEGFLPPYTTSGV